MSEQSTSLSDDLSTRIEALQAKINDRGWAPFIQKGRLEGWEIINDLLRVIAMQTEALSRASECQLQRYYGDPNKTSRYLAGDNDAEYAIKQALLASAPLVETAKKLGVV